MIEMTKTRNRRHLIFGIIFFAIAACFLVIGVSRHHETAHGKSEMVNIVDTNVAHGNGTQGTPQEALNDHYGFNR